MVEVTSFKPTSTEHYASDSDAIHGEGSFDTESDGPWMIETQSLTIDYVRVPIMGVSSFVCNLASGTANYEIEKTTLAIAVTAVYSKEKVYGGYGTTSYQQPQKFQVNAISTDHKGNSYGALTGSALGPAGTIVTYQPWMQRRFWNSTDTVVNRTMTGWLYFVPRDTCQGLLCMPQCNSRFMTDFEGHSVQSDDMGKFIECQFIQHDSQAHLKVFGEHYMIPGPYSTNKENLGAVISLIDSMGNKVTNIKFLPEAQAEKMWPLPTSEGFSEYNIARHDYT